MNEVIKAMKERRSIRKFKAEMPPKADLEQIVEAGLYAANGRGRQAVITIAVTDKELRDKLSAVNNEIMGGRRRVGRHRSLCGRLYRWRKSCCST